MEDITPGLIESIKAEFASAYEKSGTIQELLDAVRDGTATYRQAQQYAIEASRLIGAAYQKCVSSGTLPDGRMYYNIASRLIPATLDENYNLVAEYAKQVQQSLNRRAGLGVKPMTPQQNEDRVDGMVQLAASGEDYERVSGKLLSAFETYSQSIVDETIQTNVDFHGRAGLRPKVIRRATGRCCDWCRALAGAYDYPVDREVYQRHENCRCTVLYDPGDGRRQNVHSKRWTTETDPDIIEARKRFRLDNIDTFNPNSFSGISNRLSKRTPEEILQAAKDGKIHKGVYVDAMKKTPGELKRSIIHRRGQVEHHFEKIAHPEKYVANWNELDPRNREGLLRKWQKDAARNAEQAEIEVAVYKERFGK